MIRRLAHRGDFNAETRTRPFPAKTAFSSFAVLKWRQWRQPGKIQTGVSQISCGVRALSGFASRSARLRRQPKSLAEIFPQAVFSSRWFFADESN